MQILLLIIGSCACLGLLAAALWGDKIVTRIPNRLVAAKRRLGEDLPLAQSEPDGDRSVVWRTAGNRLARFIPNHADLEAQLDRIGTPLTLDQYIAGSAGIFCVLFLVLLLLNASVLLAIGLALILAILVPKMILSHLVKRRDKAFIARFPDALDLMVRGLRSGFPVTEVIDLVATEITGPVGDEFRAIGDKMRIGLTLDSALRQVDNKLKIQEFSFFCVAIAIQRRTGGNLGEALNNLSDVLRKRGQMRLKIVALTSEVRASSYVVGALPFVVTLAICYVNPDYLAPFLTDKRLMIAGVGGAIWLGIGMLILAKMADLKI